MVTAVVGVLGTLSAAVLAQFMAARNSRATSRDAEARRNFGSEGPPTPRSTGRRVTSTPCLKDALHRLRDGAYGDEDRTELERVRRAYRDRYAEIQMIVPARILNASRDVNAVLADVDAAVKRLDRGRQPDGETAESVLEDLRKAAPKLHALSEQMRADLGVVN